MRNKKIERKRRSEGLKKKKEKRARIEGGRVKREGRNVETGAMSGKNW